MRLADAELGRPCSSSDREARRPRRARRTFRARAPRGAARAGRPAGAAPAAPADPAAVPLHRRPRAGGDRARSPTCSSTGVDELPVTTPRHAVREHRRLVDAIGAHVVVCCGSGGVGKTTTAAVLAVEGARRGPTRRRRHDRPGQAARQHARARRAVQRRRARSTATRWDPERVAPIARRRAVGADARHEVDVRRARHAVRRRRRSRPSASSTTASTATSPARSRARRSTWRWRSCTSCTRRAAST